jgi:hypothetical protein
MLPGFQVVDVVEVVAAALTSAVAAAAGAPAAARAATAPVAVLGAPRTTLLITGAVFVAAGAGTEDAVAAGTTSCPVATAAGNEVAAPATPSSRRAAASITHDAGDCTGDAGPLPNSGAHTDSTRPDAAGFGGAANMTG